jgi:hypothetical protein
MPLNWKDNFWYNPKQVKFKRGDAVQVKHLTPSRLYPSEMLDTVGEIGAVERNNYNDTFGPTVEVYFRKFGDFWNFLPIDLEKV